jgi:hypothetical protein
MQSDATFFNACLKFYLIGQMMADNYAIDTAARFGDIPFVEFTKGLVNHTSVKWKSIQNL